MKVWIDLSNSPHPLLFAPVARRLEERDHTVVVTARDNAQTVQLARERWPSVEVIGGESPGGRVGKATSLLGRVRELRRWARLQRPDLALSHNSYAQIVAARLARLPIVTAMDFEHQPANHLAFRLANSILVPEVMPQGAIRKQGAKSSKVHRYPGLKEELYLGDFELDDGVLRELGIERDADTAVVVVRTPPSRALYHRLENPLFIDVLKTLGRQSHARVVVLARHPEQVRAIEGLELSNVLVPAVAIDSRSLMYAADLVIGAGGTMTREAALMGVPTLTVFAGAPPAVDRSLEREGRLQRLTNPEQVASVQRRTSQPQPLDRLHKRSEKILGPFVEVIEQTGASPLHSDKRA